MSFKINDRVSLVDYIPSEDKHITRKGVIVDISKVPHLKSVGYVIDWDKPNPEIDCHSYSADVLTLLPE